METGTRRRARGETSTVAAFCLGATWRRTLSGYLVLAVLVGGLGGLAMGSIAAARRTQSSYAVYLKSTNPPDILGVTAVLNPLIGSDVGYSAAAVARVARLPHVVHTISVVGLDVLPLRDGRPFVLPGLPISAGNGEGLVNASPLGTYSVVRGRNFDPRRADDVVVLQFLARAAHWRLGQRVTFGVYTNAQTNQPDFGTTKVRPYRVVTVTIVGIVAQSTGIIEDDVDFTDSVAYFTPAFTDPLLECCVNFTGTAVQVRPASAIASVVKEYLHTKEAGFPVSLTSDALTKADLSLRPLSIALGTFGAIVAVAALVIGSQVAGRILRRADPVRRGLWSLGASPLAVAWSGLIGVILALAAGVVLAVGVAVALSPLAPIGPVRPYYPFRGLSFDGLVLGVGAASLMAILVAAVVLLEWRLAPSRVAARRRRRPPTRSRVAAAASKTGLPAPVTTGLRFALEPGRGTSRVPVRSVIVAGVLSLVVLVSTVTFGASLDSLVAHPRLYGWNWNYLLSAGAGAGNIPAGAARRLLAADPAVAAWSGVYTDSLTIDGQLVPMLGERPGAAIQPPLLEGHGLRSANQIVLAPATMAALHARLGSTVTFEATGPPTRLRVVGEATFPALGTAGEQHLEMGTGALIADSLIPGPAKNPFHDPTPGPQGIVVRLVAGSHHGLASLRAIAAKLSNQFNFGVAVIAVLHPAEIINYRSAGTTPAVLGGALGVGVVAALLLTLMASARARRRDLAILKSLGFTRRQLIATIVSQSAVAGVVSVVVGVPVGVAVGRGLWDLFAREIYAVPAPAVPVGLMVAISLGSVLLAGLVAALPGRRAARVPAAEALRAE